MRKAGITVRPGDIIKYVMCTNVEHGTQPRMAENVALVDIGIEYEYKHNR
jgi:hypothetical protein